MDVEDFLKSASLLIFFFFKCMYVFKYRYLSHFPYQEKDRLALGSVCAPLALSVIVIVWVGVRRCICLSGKCSTPLLKLRVAVTLLFAPCYFINLPFISVVPVFSLIVVFLSCFSDQVLFNIQPLKKQQMCVGDTIYVHVSY